MDSEESATMINIAKVDMLGKLSSLFDQLLPFEKITSSNEWTKRLAIDNMKSQDKAIAHLIQLKERMRDKVAHKAT